MQSYLQILLDQFTLDAVGNPKVNEKWSLFVFKTVRSGERHHMVPASSRTPVRGSMPDFVLCGADVFVYIQSNIQDRAISLADGCEDDVQFLGDRILVSLRTTVAEDLVNMALINGFYPGHEDTLPCVGSLLVVCHDLSVADGSVLCQCRSVNPQVDSCDDIILFHVSLSRCDAYGVSFATNTHRSCW